MAQDFTECRPHDFSINPPQSQYDQTATSGSTAKSASGFSGGFTLKTFDGRTESIDADDFLFESPNTVTFYKKNNRVALRVLSQLTSISAR